MWIAKRPVMLNKNDGTVHPPDGSGQAVQPLYQAAGIELRSHIGKRALLHIDDDERLSHFATYPAGVEIPMSEPPLPLDVSEKESPDAGAGSATAATWEPPLQTTKVPFE